MTKFEQSVAWLIRPSATDPGSGETRINAIFEIEHDDPRKRNASPAAVIGSLGRSLARRSAVIAIAPCNDGFNPFILGASW
jgi:hypothetical protein